MVLIRHLKMQRPEAGGKFLLECPGYSFQVLVTNLPEAVEPLEVSGAGIMGVPAARMSSANWTIAVALAANPR